MSKNRNKEVLVVGADGKIGKSLVSFLQEKGYSVWETTRHKESMSKQRVLIDLSNDSGEWNLPDVIFDTVYFCAAITSIEKCNADPEGSRRINVVNTVLLSEKLMKTGTMVIFLSTNAVFDGETPFAKSEAPHNPLNEYGKQKAEAEIQLAALQGNLAIVRLGKVVLPGTFLFRDWLDHLEKKETFHPFYDMVMAPVSIDLALEVLHKIASQKLTGNFQLTASEDISYAAAALYLCEAVKGDNALIKPVSYQSRGISFSPKYTTLDGGRLTEIGMVPPPPAKALDVFLLNLYSGS